MDGRHIDPEARADALLDAYVADLAARLHGPRGRRRMILAELRDGLAHATDRRIRSGKAPEEAAAEGIAEFGAPDRVANAFAGELVIAHARRTIVALIATGPMVGIWWLLSLRPEPWRTDPSGLLASIPALPLIIIAIAIACATVATSGRLIRWLPEITSRRALLAAASIASLCIAGDLTMILFAIASGMVASGPLPLIAIGASVIRVAGSAMVIRAAYVMDGWNSGRRRSPRMS